MEIGNDWKGFWNLLRILKYSQPFPDLWYLYFFHPFQQIWALLFSPVFIRELFSSSTTSSMGHFSFFTCLWLPEHYYHYGKEENWLKFLGHHYIPWNTFGRICYQHLISKVKLDLIKVILGLNFGGKEQST